MAISATAQESRKNVIYSYFEGRQPNSKINIHMGHDAETGLTGQEFTIVIKNLTQHKLKVYGRYFANLVCGGTKDGNIEIELKPGESKGGDAYLFDVNGLTQTVQPEDCKAVNKTRIKGVAFQITSVTDLTEWEQEKSEQPTNSKSSNSYSTSNNSTYQNSTSGSNYSNSNRNSTTNSYNNSSNYNRNQAIMNNLNTQLENNRRTTEAITSGIQQIGNLFLQNQQRKQAEREAAAERRRQQEEAEEQRQEQQRQREAEEQEQQRQEQLRIAEENRIRAENDKKAMDNQWNLDMRIIGENLVLNKKTSEIPDNIKQVYYIAYQRNYNTGEVTLSSYTLNKYSDDTWMPLNDLLGKIGFQPYFNTGGVGQLLGFYTSKKAASGILTRIKNTAHIKTSDDSFLPITNAVNIVNADHENTSENKAEALQQKAYTLDTSGNYALALKYYREAAALGNLYALNNIGVFYENGTGVKKDDTEAAKWYQKAADRGLAIAQRNLGGMYEAGNGVKQNDTEAIKWYLKAAEQQDETAQVSIANLYTRRENYPEAEKWYRKAAAQQNEEAILDLAYFYQYGHKGVPQNYDEAVTFFKQLAGHNNSLAQLSLGNIYANGWDDTHPFQPAPTETAANTSTTTIDAVTADTVTAVDSAAAMGEMVTGVPRNYSEAMKWFKMAADNGDADAMIKIGAMYALGNGVSQDNIAAEEWFNKAMANNTDAVLSIALSYYSGFYGATKPHYPEAMKWLHKGADKGNYTAMMNIGFMYCDGKGVEKNDVEANNWFSKAAQKGGKDAMETIGASFYYGNNDKYSEALKWYKKAAAAGADNANYMLGVMYEEGQGVTKNIDTAIIYYRKAAAAGNSAAKEALKKLGKNETTTTPSKK